MMIAKTSLVSVVLISAVSVALADTLVLKNGGSDVAQVSTGKATVTTKPQRSQGEPTEKHVRPTCFVIPIKGTFGLEVTGSLFNRSLNMAHSAKPTVLILDIDSRGGKDEVLLKMLAALEEHKDLRVAAYVREATSNAAILAMACREIVIAPAGVIGACIEQTEDSGGVPGRTRRGASRFRRSRFWAAVAAREAVESAKRARFRAAVSAAGHDPLLVEGMIRMDIVLRVVDDNGRPRIVRNLRAESRRSRPRTQPHSPSVPSRAIKSYGELLTLTGEEAVACGLALGTSESIGQMNRLLGIEEWQARPRSAASLYLAWTKELAKAERRWTTLVGRVSESLGKEGIEIVWDGGGRLRHPRSLGESKRRIRELIELLKETEKGLTAPTDIASRYPQLAEYDRILPADETRGLATEIAALRDQLKAKLETMTRRRPRRPQQRTEIRPRSPRRQHRD